MADISEVWQSTYTVITLRPQTYTDDGGITSVYINAEIRVDAIVAGQGKGKTLGQAIVAAGLDMMGLDGELLPLALEMLKERRECR